MRTRLIMLLFVGSVLLLSLSYILRADTPPVGTLSRREHVVLKRDAVGDTIKPSASGRSSRAEMAAGWVPIVNEDFEGAFPGVWAVGDQLPGHGEYYWGKRDCRAHAGSNSAWAVGGGADGAHLACGDSYPHDANSWMVYGPFSLVDATAADLTFKVWLNSEAEHDILAYLASVDGEHFYGAGISGNSQGWLGVELDLTDIHTLGNVMGQPQVWVAVVFQSDSQNSNPEGAYVDDIVLRKYVGAVETTTPTATVTAMPHPSPTPPWMDWRIWLPMVLRLWPIPH